MKKDIESVVCGCCGEKTEVEILASMLIQDRGLDNKPQYQWQLPIIQECPNCHYCHFSIGQPVSEDVKKIVMSQQYQEIMKKSCEDVYDRSVKAAAKLSKSIQDKIYLYLIACWNSEFHDQMKAAKAMRKRVVKLMEGYFLEQQEVGMVLTYIDSQRQLGRFDGALETARSIEQAVEENVQKEDILYQILQFEKRLLNASDSKAHMISEMKL